MVFLAILNNNVIFSAGTSQYCQGESAITILINNYNWIITDNGEHPNCSDCPNNRILSDNPILDGTYLAAQSITSSGTIPTTGNVIFQSGLESTLLPGFCIELGGVFDQIIDSCY